MPAWRVLNSTLKEEACMKSLIALMISGLLASTCAMAQDSKMAAPTAPAAAPSAAAPAGEEPAKKTTHKKKKSRRAIAKAGESKKSESKPAADAEKSTAPSSEMKK